MSYDLQLNDGDLVIDSGGDILVVENYDKLYQDLYRLALTSRGDNIFDPEEGCGIYDLLGHVIPRDLAEGVLGKEIYYGIQHMIAQQENQALIQVVSPYEKIALLDGVVIENLTIKSISINLLITTEQGTKLAFGLNVTP